jgi:hypothetical protein
MTFTFTHPSGWAGVYMRFLGLLDICARWGNGAGNYSRRGVYNLRQSEDFPEPLYMINQGQTPIWALDDIQDFEQDHPEVLDEKLKIAKVASYARCNRLKMLGG